MKLPQNVPINVDDLGIEEDMLLAGAANEAFAYLSQFNWVKSIAKAELLAGVSNIIAVVKCEIVPAQEGVDTLLWVISGDLPSAYLVLDDAETPVQAVEIYCKIMGDWANAVLKRRNLREYYPVAAPPTKENAKRLLSRIELLQKKIIPELHRAG
jgi:hypothetical protein